MAALQGLLYIMRYVCGQKPDILIYKITVASKSNLEFRNRNKFRLQFCKDPCMCWTHVHRRKRKCLQDWALAGNGRKTIWPNWWRPLEQQNNTEGEKWKLVYILLISLMRQESLRCASVPMFVSRPHCSMHWSLHNKMGHLFLKQHSICLGWCAKRKENIEKHRDYAD